VAESSDSEKVDLPYLHYQCPRCGKELPLSEARITVTCTEHRPADEAVAFSVRGAKPADRRAVEEICDSAWGETEIDCFGRTFDVLEADNIIAEVDGRLAGLISLAIDRGEQAVVMLSVYPEHQGAGIGAALLEEAVARAEAAGLPFVKVATSNDDIPALYFYQRHRFLLYEIETGVLVDHHGAVLSGFANIPIRDEVRLRRPACRA
jgi:GNAT superfamily N-acetyltransferase